MLSNIEQGKVEKYAIKKVAKELLDKHNPYENILNEENNLAKCDCKFIVKIITIFGDAWFIYFVMEFAVGGDAYSLIKNNSPKLDEFKLLGENAVRFLAGCVVLGLEFFHQNGYMYRDLKPETMLLF